ncbi:hypothetical protein [Streptomyces anulatus]|uniref:hypothetical protein n=1 Tax=Streptomyces anulatus TaxID=1892 RepID=UPI00386FE44F|nr:hypothetical protein OG238_40145 [Streptomyces anulatus]
MPGPTAADAEQAWQLADAVSAARDLPIAIVLPANDATRGAFPAAEKIATAPRTPVTLPQLGKEPVQLQRLTDEQYRQYLHALQVAEEPAEPAAGTWQLAEAHEQTAAAPRPEPHPVLRIRTSDGEAAGDPGSPIPRPPRVRRRTPDHEGGLPAPKPLTQVITDVGASG